MVEAINELLIVIGVPMGLLILGFIGWRIYEHFKPKVQIVETLLI